MRSKSPESRELLRKIRISLGIFIVFLIFSGITAFPLLKEFDLLTSAIGLSPTEPSWMSKDFREWLLKVHEGLRETYERYPFMAYGTDWLAFGHVAIAIFFIGPFIQPVRNIWVLYSGIAACILVVPTALICGEIRGIPFLWRIIDCSFGVIGFLPLWYSIRLTQKLARSYKF